jgi:hypothetical protein
MMKHFSVMRSIFSSQAMMKKRGMKRMHVLCQKWQFIANHVTSRSSERDPIYRVLRGGEWLLSVPNALVESDIASVDRGHTPSREKVTPTIFPEMSYGIPNRSP